jgi:hypothetical protein
VRLATRHAVTQPPATSELSNGIVHGEDTNCSKLPPLRTVVLVATIAVLMHWFGGFGFLQRMVTTALKRT